mmetsp:Transcript_21860/g.47987  ORF Transcript_21860/g.47987 Transcript_21860/m.47987 type:complete len:289 (-) Transcript_21860:226-1092(-)
MSSACRRYSLAVSSCTRASTSVPAALSSLEATPCTLRDKRLMVGREGGGFSALFRFRKASGGGAYGSWEVRGLDSPPREAVLGARLGSKGMSIFAPLNPVWGGHTCSFELLVTLFAVQSFILDCSLSTRFVGPGLIAPGLGPILVFRLCSTRFVVGMGGFCNDEVMGRRSASPPNFMAIMLFLNCLSISFFFCFKASISFFFSALSSSSLICFWAGTELRLPAPVTLGNAVLPLGFSAGLPPSRTVLTYAEKGVSGRDPGTSVRKVAIFGQYGKIMHSRSKELSTDWG